MHAENRTERYSAADRGQVGQKNKTKETSDKATDSGRKKTETENKTEWIIQALTRAATRRRSSRTASILSATDSNTLESVVACIFVRPTTTELHYSLKKQPIEGLLFCSVHVLSDFNLLDSISAASQRRVHVQYMTVLQDPRTYTAPSDVACDWIS